MRIALAGNPNSGKTTMYNALTGRNEKVGNWAGVTVDKNQAHIKKAYAGEPITVISRRRGTCVVSIKDGRYTIGDDLAECIFL